MTIQRINVNDPDLLVYRQRRATVRASVGAMLGLAFLSGTAWRMVLEWPRQAGSYAGGIVLCFTLVVWSLRKSLAADLVLDRKRRELATATRCPWMGTSRKTIDISAAEEVRRCSFSPVEDPDFHWISLGMTGGGELKLFDEASFDDLIAGDADRMAGEIAGHLGLPVVSVTNNVRSTDMDVGCVERKGMQ